LAQLTSKGEQGAFSANQGAQRNIKENLRETRNAGSKATKLQQALTEHASCRPHGKYAGDGGKSNP